MLLEPWPAVAGTLLEAAGGIDGLNGTLPRRVTSKRRPLRPRKYIHFDDPLTNDQLDSFEITPAEVERHAFLPLLGYTKVIRHMDFSGDFPALEPKPREIRYAGHNDSAIYSVYSRQLAKFYDDELRRRNLDGIILAYRSGIGNNIDFAKGLFDEIRRRRECVVICADVSKFFDNLDHRILKRNLARTLGVAALPKDWLKIFIRLTSYEYVLQEDLEPLFGRIRGRRICDATNFRKLVRPKIRRHPHEYGIPQGTPLSGLFANIYMFDFDDEMNRYVRGLGGSYRRYSDDIAIVLPRPSDETVVLKTLTQALADRHLTLNERKTCISTIEIDGFEQRVEGDELQYLGFTFDGRRILIRPGSIKNFYARMKRGIRRYIKAAHKKGIAAGSIRKRVPIGRFTHWGDDRNFVQYAYRAARAMNSPDMKRQLRNHVRIFDDQWAKMIAKYYGALPAA